MKKITTIKRDNYIVIQSWMSRELGLKGNQLLIYALIYGFSQTEKQVCTCGIEYMRQWIQGSKSTVIRTINELSEMGLIERAEGQDEDGRVMGYAAVSPQQIGSEMTPIIGEKGSNLRPNSNKKKVAICNKIGPILQQIGPKMTPNNIYNIYNNMTDLSVSQRACAREDETDGQTEKEFYLDCIRERLDKLEDPYKEDYESRFKDILTELSRWDKVKINGADTPTEKILEAILDLFRDPNSERLRTALVVGCNERVKKKFNYTVAALYNAAKQF